MSDSHDRQIFACAALISLQHVNLLSAEQKAEKSFEIADAMCELLDADRALDNDGDAEQEREDARAAELDALEERAYNEGKQAGIDQEQKAQAASAASVKK